MFIRRQIIGSWFRNIFETSDGGVGGVGGVGGMGGVSRKTVCG